MGQLRELAKQHKNLAWDLGDKSNLKDSEKALVRKFKKLVKDHLYHSGQRNFCCYCGSELSDHQASYDLEHCISKNGMASLVFEFRNLALSCKPCNGGKHAERIRVFPLDDYADSVSEGSDKYRTVHPHFDKWSEHLAFDEYKRVVAIDGLGLTKGRLTIKLFGIEKKNATALANHFDMFRSDASSRKDWIDFYRTFKSEDVKEKKQKYKSFLEKLVSLPGDPAADELRRVLGLTVDGN